MKQLYKLVCAALILAAFAGCETPAEKTVAEPLYISFAPHFVIKNESSRDQSVELKKAYCSPVYNPASENLTQEMYWDFQEGEADSPVSCTLAGGTEAALETWTSARVDIEFPMVLSFMLTINGKRYAGWTAGIGNIGIPIDRYGLGYVAANPSNLAKLNQAIAESTDDTIGDLRNYDLPGLTSVLPAKSSEVPKNPLYIDAVYTITITDGAVEITLEKDG